MKVLYIDYNMYGKEDIIKAFIMLGGRVDVTDIPLIHGETSEKTRQELMRILDEDKYDIVFTSNYYPVVSDICMYNNIKYLSWTYDSPRISLYDKSITNPCNYAFTFDSSECQNLREKGVNTVYYMPLAAAVDHIKELQITDSDRRLFGAQVGLVASLYNEEHNLYDRMKERLDEYTKGYLDAVIRAQSNLIGGNIFDCVLDDTSVLEAMYRSMPYSVDDGSFANLQYVYSNYFLCRKTATIQRLEYIKTISERYEMKVYTPGDISDIPSAIHMGVVDYNTDMYKVFRLSKININITLPSIQSGIPLRAMDIMGAGGFLLTNYQSDFEGLFEPDYEYVYYTSLQDALSKIDYYLKHEDERKSIAENGRKKIEEYFTYYNQVKQMLEIGEIVI